MKSFTARVTYIIMSLKSETFHLNFLLINSWSISPAGPSPAGPGHFLLLLVNTCYLSNTSLYRYIMGVCIPPSVNISISILLCPLIYFYSSTLHQL